MKLLTQQLVRNELFRKRLLALCEKRLLEMSFKSDNDCSVDHEDRVSGVDFLTVPQDPKITEIGPDEVSLQARIRVELALQTQIHGIDTDQTVHDTLTKTIKFSVNVTGRKVPQSQSMARDIQALQLSNLQLQVIGL